MRTAKAKGIYKVRRRYDLLLFKSAIEYNHEINISDL